jgi:hypothetical protein
VGAACGTGCFEKLNEDGETSPLPTASGTTGWATEESLDVDMVSAICPNCHIILVEANSSSIDDLGTGVDAAVNAGAQYVSNSYGADEFADETSYDGYYDHPGTVVTVSAGDRGYGVEFPAVSQYVTAVGGTSLTTASNSRGWAETVWGSSSGGEGTGSGCSQYEPAPAWQLSSDQCSNRENNDVAAVADPNTGVAVYDTYDQGGWLEVGGTSASSPIIAAVYALAGLPAAGAYPSSYPYGDPSALNDVTSGANGTCTPTIFCTAGSGYDGPTGLGTPNGVAAFQLGPTTTGLNPSANPGIVGNAVTLTATVTNQVSGGSPTGTVTFKDGATVLGGDPVSAGGGTATLSTASLAAGDHSITASYSGDADHGSSSSSPVTLAVADPPTAGISSPSSGHTYFVGQSVKTSFSCTEGALGSGISVCQDSNGSTSGAGHLNTLKPGSLSYVVAAVSKDGGAGYASISYKVSKAPTKLSALSASVSGLSATLKSAYTGAPLAGQKLVFRAGSHGLCTVGTSSSGKASCRSANAVAYAAMHLGFKVSFAGTGHYLRSSATKSAESLAKTLLNDVSASVRGSLNGVSGLAAELKEIGHSTLVAEVKQLRKHHSHTTFQPTLF